VRHYRLGALSETGHVVLDDYRGQTIPRSEWERLAYVDWKSGGDTVWAPLASAAGELNCRAFWAHGRPDKEGVWTRNAQVSPGLVRWVQSVGASFGRVRVIKLNPSGEEHALRQLHLDDNNRLNPDGQGWIVRAWLELATPPGSTFILRKEKDDPSTETRIPLHRGRQLLIDTERLYHCVHNPGPGPRYALITSLESGPALEAWCARGT
jgi:hypothetical protein